MGLVEKWNKLAKKKIYINDTLEIGIGRLFYMVFLNFFIMMGMMFSGTTAASIAWLWVDLFGSLKKPNKEKEYVEKVKP